MPLTCLVKARRIGPEGAVGAVRQRSDERVVLQPGERARERLGVAVLEPQAGDAVLRSPRAPRSRPRRRQGFPSPWPPSRSAVGLRTTAKGRPKRGRRAYAREPRPSASSRGCGLRDRPRRVRRRAARRRRRPAATPARRQASANRSGPFSRAMRPTKTKSPLAGLSLGPRSIASIGLETSCRRAFAGRRPATTSR